LMLSIMLFSRILELVLIHIFYNFLLWIRVACLQIKIVTLF